jgi:uncharacterized membrane protein YhaH (DUF805 family)
MLASLKHGLGGLLRFSGRDGLRTYWPYAGVVMGLAAAAMLTGLVTIVVSLFSKLERYVREHPEMVTVEADGSEVIHGDPDVMPDFDIVFGGAAGIALVFVALILAASVRRLHDAGRPGWWAVLPLPFLAICLAAGRVWAQSLEPPVDLDLGALGIMAGGWLGCLLSVAALTGFLAARGSPEANRFGPQE